MNNKEFFKSGIATVKIAHWLDWASGRQDAMSRRIVLPMIQRGSVWKPHQVMDLWDTLLRGMPLGSMLASVVHSDAKYFDPITRELLGLPEEGGLSLLDGQQRTLAMLLTWPEVEIDMKRRVWIDLGVEDDHDHLFRFLFSTENHPFGYGLARASGTPVSKLSVAERKAALAAYADVYQAEGDKPVSAAQRRQKLWDNASVRPWSGLFPLNLKDVMRVFQQSADSHDAFTAAITTWLEEQKNWLNKRLKTLAPATQDDTMSRAIRHFEKKFRDLEVIPETELKRRIQRLFESLRIFSNQCMPVIELPDRVFSTGQDDLEKDPALAVLFQRIGTGGTVLSNADYVYSVIKHRNPACHTLVETLLGNERIAVLFTPVTLVTTAVRLTAARLGLSDYARIDKAQFSRLLQDPRFLGEFNASIAPDGCFSVSVLRTTA